MAFSVREEGQSGRSFKLEGRRGRVKAGTDVVRRRGDAYNRAGGYAVPELPEVETVVRDLRPLLVGRRFTGVWVEPLAAAEAVEGRVEKAPRSAGASRRCGGAANGS